MHAQLGMIYFQQHDFARAVPTLRQALKLKPGLPNVDILLAMCLSEIGQYEEALPGLQKGFGQSSDTALRRMTGLQLQRTYTGLGQDDKAVEVALQLTRLYKDDPEVLYHTGRLFSNYAYLMTMRLAEVAPTSVWMHQAAGEANESLASYDGALDEYRKVLALAPDRPGIHYRLGRVFLARARPPLSEADAEANAAREFEQELRIDPTNADAAYELGEIRRKAGDLDKARELFELAVEHYPEFEQGLVGLGPGARRPGEGGPRPASSHEGGLAEPGRRRRLVPALPGAPGAGPPRGAGEGAGGVPAPARPEARAGTAEPAPPARGHAAGARRADDAALGQARGIAG